MISGLGLGKFNPVEMKELTKSNSKSSSFDLKSNNEVAPRSNTTSVAPNKSLEKSNKNFKAEFNKKVDKAESKSSVDIEKLDKNEIEQFENEVKKSKVADIPQMQMLQGVQPVFVNQQAQSVKETQEVGLNLDVKVSEQNTPVLKFLKAMQENFGIKPHQVMKALQELDPEIMMQSPHQAMTPLFEKLGIQPKQFTKAQILYVEMLSEMEQTQPELFKGSVPVATTASVAPSATLLQADHPIQEYGRPAAAPKSTLDQLIEQKIARRALEPQNIQGALPKASAPQVNMAQIFNVEPQVQAPELQGVAIDKLQNLDPSLRIEEVKINPNRVTEQFMSQAPIETSFNVAANENELSDQTTGEEGRDLAEQLMPLSQDRSANNQFVVDKLSTATGSGISSQAGQLSNENVEKIISGSQTLIQKGGGEMKIQLNPEGLGQIHLKIKVQDGQVGVQMTADTVEAKKLLESNMDDLKVSLAEHKLSLNNLKVDVAEQASQNMSQNFDFKREEARDFLGQFRQFNESFRQGAHETSGMRAYKKAAQTTPDIQPIEAKKAEAAKSGGLYLVA